MSAKVRWLRGAWWVVHHANGKKWTKKVGPNLKLAERLAEQLAARAVLGDDFPQRQRAEKSIYFSQYAEEWYEREVELPIRRKIEGALAPATGRLHRGHLDRYLKPFFGQMNLRAIAVVQVEDFYDRCLRTGKPHSARSIEMILVSLRQILKSAHSRKLIDSNAVQDWKRGRSRRRSDSARRHSRENVLDSAELERFLKLAEAHYPADYAFLIFLAHTGTRLGEASALRWSDLDLELGRAQIVRSFSNGKDLTWTKSGRERRIELSPVLFDVLRSRRPDQYDDDTLAFPSDAGRLRDPHNFRSRVFEPLVKLAFGPGRRFTPHGLRHTFATLHLAQGTPIKWIQAAGGWATAQLVLDTYGHHQPSESHGYASRMPGGGSDSPATPGPEATGHDRKDLGNSRGMS